MSELLYAQNEWVIAALLVLSMVLAMEAGYRLGWRRHPDQEEATRSHVMAIQGSLLGLLALMLGFTYSLAEQRFDSRSEAIVSEVNALGTAYLRTGLLPAAQRDPMRAQLRAFLDARIEEGSLTIAQADARAAQLARAEQALDRLWELAVAAAPVEPAAAVRHGLLIEALNGAMDAYGMRNAVLNRHVPEVVLLLLYATYLLTGLVMGYAAGSAGHRPSTVAYVMALLIVLLVCVIIDLDRPRRGLIGVDRSGLTALQAAWSADAH